MITFEIGKRTLGKDNKFYLVLEQEGIFQGTLILEAHSTEKGKEYVLFKAKEIVIQ